MTQNWTSIVESNWIFSKFFLLIYIYIYKWVNFINLIFFYEIINFSCSSVTLLIIRSK